MTIFKTDIKIFLEKEIRVGGYMNRGYKEKVKSKICGILLACSIVCILIPLSAQAEEIIHYGESGNVYTGTYGEDTNIKWELNEGTGVLKFEGNGVLDNRYSLKDFKTEYRAKVRTIQLGAGITDVGPGMFFSNEYVADNKWSNLEKIEVDRQNQYLCSIDGVLFNKQRTRLIRYPDKRTGSYTIPSGVKEICGNSFSCGNLNKVIMPDSVIEVGAKAFGGSQITDVQFGNGLTIIGEQAFVETQLTSVYIPKGVKEIGVRAFAYNKKLKKVVSETGLLSTQEDSYIFDYCENLTDVTVAGDIASYTFINCPAIANLTLQEGTTAIGAGAFDSKSLEEIRFPSSYKTWNPGAFQGCSNVKSYFVAQGNPWYSSLDGVLFNKNQTRLISYPQGKEDQQVYRIPEQVTDIEKYAFYNSSLQKVVVPRGITKLSRGVFEDCSALKEVILSEGITALEGEMTAWKYNAGVFHGCKALKSIVLPYTVNSLWVNDIFYGCSSVEYIVFSKNRVKMQYDTVMADCTNLKKVYGYSTTMVWTEAGTEKSLKELAGDKFVNLDNGIQLTLNANGGSISSSTKKVYPAYTYGTLPIPTRSGYTFTGWYTSATGGEKICENDIVQSVTDQTLYAHWKQGSYTVTFHPNGGSVQNGKRVIGGGETTNSFPTPTRSGYIFTGWYTQASGGNKVNGSLKITKDTTLYAHWEKEIKKYTVLFNPNGGSVQNGKQMIAEGSILSSYPTPTRSGYAFTGWYTATSGGKKVTGSIKVTENMTFYAQWVSKDIAAPQISIKITGDKSLDVSWKKVKGVKGYVLYCSDQKNGDYKKVKQTTKTKVHITGLKKGKTYYYKVRAYRVAGNKSIYGNYSKVVSRKIIGKLPTPKQKKIKLNTSDGTFTFSWNKVKGAQKVQILMSVDHGKYKVWHTVSAKKNKAVYSYRKSLKKSHKYNFKLRVYYVADKKKIYSGMSNAWTIQY